MIECPGVYLAMLVFILYSVLHSPYTQQFATRADVDRTAAQLAASTVSTTRRNMAAWAGMNIREVTVVRHEALSRSHFA